MGRAITTIRMDRLTMIRTGLVTINRQIPTPMGLVATRAAIRPRTDRPTLAVIPTGLATIRTLMDRQTTTKAATRTRTDRLAMILTGLVTTRALMDRQTPGLATTRAATRARTDRLTMMILLGTSLPTTTPTTAAATTAVAVTGLTKVSAMLLRRQDW